MPDPRAVTERVERRGLHLLYRARRLRWVARLRLLAWWKQTDLTLDVHPSVRFGRDVGVRLAPRTKVEVRIGKGSQLFDGVQLNLFGGALRFGPDVQLRPGVVVMLSGELDLAGSNIFSWGCLLHCGERIELGWAAGAGEYASVVDSGHFYTRPDVVVSQNTITAPVRIGANTFLAPRSTVNRGVTIGDYVVVGPGSVVVKDVESGMFVSGVPAKVIGPVDLPWRDGSAGPGPHQGSE